MLTIKENLFIDGREIHKMIESGTKKYTTWAKRAIGYAELKEGVDYITFRTLIPKGQPRIDFDFTINAAKEICLLERNEKGKQIRRWLIELSRQKEEFELLNHEQILVLLKIKSFFCYVDNQVIAEKEYIDKVYKESNENKFAVIDFHKMRNKALNIETQTIENLIKSYCIENQKAYPKNASKREKMNILDSYAGLRNAVWDFLNIKGQVNSVKLANLVKQMAITDGSIVLSKNEDNLFQTKKQVELPESIKALTA